MAHLKADMKKAGKIVSEPQAVPSGRTWKGGRKAYTLGNSKEFSEGPDQAADVGDHSSLVRSLLVSRGIRTRIEAEIFLNPDFDAHMHDPFLMKGMDRAVKRIMRAIELGERIAIYSDYDADGIPGGVIMHDFFKKIGHENFVNYIPHRNLEGFGLNIEAVEKLAEDGVKLLITVDCGITDIAEIDRANELGMDVVVTDHHLPSQAGLPKAHVIVDPKQEGCGYPFKELCGAALAYKLVSAIFSQNRFGVKEGWEKWLLDMAGVSTLSDMVPLSGENRVIAFFGLKVLRRTSRVGLLKLARRMKLNVSSITEDDIGFSISPRINAASRMGVPMDAFRLLATRDETEADMLADHLNKINDERKGIVAAIVRDVKKHFAGTFARGEMKQVLVAGNPEWKPSLLGLVANSLVEEYRRPVFLWGREGGHVLKGSCRSDGVANVVELMAQAKDVFIDFGGHKMSGGFSMQVDTAHLIEDELVKACEASKTIEGSLEVVSIDGVLALDEVNWQTYRQIEKLSPFGLANPKPIFAFESVAIDEVRTFGKGDLHLELRFQNSSGRTVSAIAFFTKPESFPIPLGAGKKINLIASMEMSTFKSFPELRLRIVDVC